MRVSEKEKESKENGRCREGVKERKREVVFVFAMRETEKECVREREGERWKERARERELKENEE